MEAEADFYKKKRQECLAAQRNSSLQFGNSTTCPWVFDGYLCWPETEEGITIFQKCPDFVLGFQNTYFAHKICQNGGTWFRHPETDKEWSNYTTCVDNEDLEFRSAINTWYIYGYTTSLIALIVSLVIFLSFRSLRCTRIKLHIQLFLSLSLTCIAWIVWYKKIVRNPEIFFEYHVSMINMFM